MCFVSGGDEVEEVNDSNTLTMEMWTEINAQHDDA